jgi:flagellar biosynthesis/type III secretory pathway protein FliH
VSEQKAFIFKEEYLGLEVDDMCNLSRGIAEEGIRQGIQQGLQQGLQQGEDMFAQLMQKLFALGRADDARRAAEDKVYRHELMKEMLGENQ